MGPPLSVWAQRGVALFPTGLSRGVLGVRTQPLKGALADLNRSKGKASGRGRLRPMEKGGEAGSGPGSRPPGEIALARGRAALVIAADGGLRHLEAQGLTADLIVGDFDSLGRVPEGDNILRHPVEKDDTDMLLAVRTGLDRGYRIFVLYGGLGGRLDATNAVGVPLVSIITKIGYDHMEVLGDTLSEIAGEKAGILKKGTRAVFSVQEPEAFETLKQRCDSLKIPFCTVDGTKIVPLESGFCYPDEQAYRMEMPGAYQRENALAAILAARELMELGYPVTEDALHRGIEKTVWKGRMETICKEPYLLIDGAHNSDGVAALAKSLREMFPGEKFHFIMGVLADKDYRKMAEFMLPLAQKVTAVTPKSERALAAEDLAQYFRKHGIPAESRTDLKEALQPFLGKPVRAGTNERTVAFGSLYFIGEIRDILNLC